MTYASPTWELVADICLLKLQRMQNKVPRTIGNSPRGTLVRDLHTALNLLYVYGYITQVCRRQAEVIQNHENEHIRFIAQGKGRRRKYKVIKLGGGKAYDRSSDKFAVIA
jgi:hypothetical protein